MITVTINVKGASLEPAAPLIASGTAGKVRVIFKFDGEWQGLAKTAVFHTPHGDILVPLDDNCCDFPALAMTRCGEIRVGVFGTDGERTLTTVFCTVKISSGVPTSGEKATNYTPGLYEQFAAKFLRFENITVTAIAGESASAELIDRDGKMIIGFTLPRGDKGDTPVRGTDYWTDEDIAEIQTYIDEKVGDVESALDELHAYAVGLSGGETE